ncbi:TPA: dTDP-4-dehydrorhamnose reductase [Vibrio campbellii]|uniref:dTDP-4-dehydrorhamnose reductase n=1 Tax=Vibrio campbellii TaxID=680 RepID=UPI00390B370D
MKILVTGSNGQVGTALTGLLNIRDDVELLAVHRGELDITNQTAVDKLVLSFEPDFIINAAAYTAVDKAEQEVALSYAINEQGAKYLAQAANRINATILHISTDYVFAGDKEGIYSEENETTPQGVYGASKLAGEIAVAKANTKHIILRTAWVFSEHGNNFVKTMLKLAKDKDALSIVGDQFGGPTYAGDIAKALITIVDSIASKKDQAPFGIYHYTGLPNISWFGFADYIFNCAVEQGLLKQTPFLTSIVTKQYPTPAKRPANSRLDLSKIKNSFAVEACDWRKALTNLEFYKN